jgi:hypothetical protein
MPLLVFFCSSASVGAGFASSLGASAVATGGGAVSTGGGRDEATSRVVRETLAAYYDDYHTWVNALLLSNPNQMNPRKRVR